MKPPLLIDAGLLGSAEQPADPRWMTLLSEFKQVERPLVLLAERPDRWTPTRNRVDKAFMRQATIQTEIRRAGGALDAVIYLDLGLFGRKRQYERNMADLANRYGCSLHSIQALLRRGKIADALVGIIGPMDRIDDSAQFEEALKSVLEQDRPADRPGG